MIERIYIPTVRRPDNQITYNGLPPELQKRVIMVVEPGERHLYNYDCDYLEIPEEFVGSWTQLSQTRLFIHKHAGAIKYCMADDDVLLKRRNAKYWTGVSNMEKSIRTATSQDILEAFEDFDKWLDEDDIGVAGCAFPTRPPAKSRYSDTQGVFGIPFIDGRMLSKVIDSMELTEIRIAEDILFLFECLSRGINTRQANEWVWWNTSLYNKSMQEKRVIWAPVNDDIEAQCLLYIAKRFPHGLTVFKKDGELKKTQHWKKLYNPQARLRTKEIRIGTGKTVKVTSDSV